MRLRVMLVLPHGSPVRCLCGVLVDDVFCVRGDCIVVCFWPSSCMHRMQWRRVRTPNGDFVMDSVHFSAVA